jgi:lipopolysaccharide/colanic/teichoic acid biosynthesis glycosyltransferase
MTSLRSKRILLVAPIGQYSDAIAQALQARGAVIDCYEERPALNVLAKTLIRYSPRLIRSYIQAYFDRIINATMWNNYDFVLLIRAEAATRKFISDLRTFHKGASIFLYQWDSMTLTKGPVDKLDLFDRTFSFDKRDCATYSMTFLPLFYLDDYRDMEKVPTDAKYDFLFIGTIHSDRFSMIREIEQYAHSHLMSSYFYMYIPAPVLFYKMKYLERKLFGAKLAEFKFSPLSRREAVQAVANAKIMIDSEHPAQLGLTMRTIEALGARRKLITTNADIVNYDFYHPNNILVVNRRGVQIPDSFIWSKYVEVDSNTYRKYSVHEWVSTIFQSTDCCPATPSQMAQRPAVCPQPRTAFRGDTMLKQPTQHGWRFWIKTGFDRSAALCGLIILSPVFIVVSVLVWLSMGRPIFFRQQRPGRLAKPFWLLKFRTMSNNRDASGKLLSDADRLTRVGRFLRATSLDELPQLWNVLRGDISLVGPRPLLMKYLARYSLEQARRHDVMPGITGWVQVNGRNALSWDEKFAMDTWYVDHWSLSLDLKILYMTARRVLRRDGIASHGHATMPEFMGVSAEIGAKNQGR